MTLCESSRTYEPGSQYMEFIRRMPLPQTKPKESAATHPLVSHRPAGPYSFEAYSEESATAAVLDKERKSNGSLSADSNDSSGEHQPSHGPLAPCLVVATQQGDRFLFPRQGEADSESTDDADQSVGCGVF